MLRPRDEFALPVLLVLSLLLTSCGGGGSGNSNAGAQATTAKAFYSLASDIPVSGPAVPGVDAYDQAVKSFMLKWNAPGVTLAVVWNGQLIVARSHGYAEYDTKQLMQPDSRMRIASASKTFTSVAILHLVEQGKLSLDDRFLDILTQFQVPPNGDQRLHQITIRQLLQHSGGWDRAISGDPTGMSATIVSALGVPAPATCSDTIRYMMGKPLDFNPGEKFAYSNFGYCILGRVVEKLSGQRYEDYVRNEVLSTMDIRGMSIGRTMLSQRGMNEVRYYDSAGAPLYQSVFPNGGKVEGPYGLFSVEAGESFGGWVASVVDLTRFMTALDGTRGNFLNPEMVTVMTAKPDLVVPDAAPGWNGAYRTDGWYGLGLFLQPDTQALTWWHWGNMPGSDAVMLRNGRGYAWAVLVNTFTTTSNAASFMSDLDTLMWNAFNGGVQGSTTDLYAQYPSPDVPPSGVQN